MGCLHPVEERHGVYEGRAVARPDRSLCSLCGELLYEPVRPRRMASEPIEGRGRANVAAGPATV
jgi:hypothetical protein